ncbi:MAG: hypothetical protein ACOX5W_11535 [Bacillota bacterium]
MKIAGNGSKTERAMATSSFDKDFTLNGKKAVRSFERIASTPAQSVIIDRSLTSPARVVQGEKRLKQIITLLKKLRYQVILKPIT